MEQRGKTAKQIRRLPIFTDELDKCPVQPDIVGRAFDISAIEKLNSISRQGCLRTDAGKIARRDVRGKVCSCGTTVQSIGNA